MKKTIRTTPRQTKSNDLLVPIDFSASSAKALEYATALARKRGAHIRVLHVLEPPTGLDYVDPVFVRWDKQVTDAAQIRLTRFATGITGGDIPLAPEIRIGRAHIEIGEVARKRKSDLIIIGSRGFTGLKHLLLGSTAERVLRHAPCSVLVVKSAGGKKEKPIAAPKRILVPTDFSKPAEQALQAAVSLARQYGARMNLLYVVPIHYAGGDYDLMDYATLAAEQKAAGRKQLVALRRKLVAQGLSASIDVRYGRPAIEINTAAGKTNADLIVIATHGRTGWHRAMLGSTTEETVRHAACPVLIVRKNS